MTYYLYCDSGYLYSNASVELLLIVCVGNYHKLSCGSLLFTERTEMRLNPKWLFEWSDSTFSENQVFSIKHLAIFFPFLKYWAEVVHCLREWLDPGSSPDRAHPPHCGEVASAFGRRGHKRWVVSASSNFCWHCSGHPGIY